MTKKSYTDAELATIRASLPFVESWLEHRAWATRVPGVQAAVYLDGGVEWSASFGIADIETDEPLTDKHLFRIASHSKTFTATAILQLAESGALRLDDPADLHVPAIAGTPVAKVTIRDLLGHSAGIIRDGLDGDYWQHGRPFPDDEEIIRIVREEAKILEPNAEFKYTNIGFSLLGLVVAGASGVSYNEYVSREICERLGLSDTGPEWVAERAGDYAAAHTGLHTSRTRTRVDHVDTRAMASATGFYSTARDLVGYFAAHRFGDERLLSDSSKRLQQRREWQTHPTLESAGHYGLGMITEKVGEHEVIGHSGGYPGHITRTILDPHTGLAISVLTNSVDGPASELAVGALAIIDYALAQPATDETPDATFFTGRFANMWGVMDIAQLGDRIVAIHPGAASPVDMVDTLVVVNDTTLRFDTGSGYGSIGEILEYSLGDDGAVTSIRGGGGMTMWPIESFRSGQVSRD
jgi:CubicO group peptidase (beta-lactamase class C family)